MVFNFSLEGKETIVKKSPKSGKSTFEEALKTSLDTTYPKQIEIIQNGIPEDNRTPSSWSYRDVKGNTHIQWRINGKPVYFTEDLEETGGWFPTNDPSGDLAGIKKSIEEGNHRDELLKAYNRTAKPVSEFTIKKRIARQEAKTNAEDTFSVGGKKYVTETGKLVKSN